MMGAGPSPSLFDLLSRELEPKIRAAVESGVQERIDAVIVEGRARLEAEIAATGTRVEEAVKRVVVNAPVALPGETAVKPSSDPVAKADARNRSWRTLLQGGIATVIVAAGGGVADAIVRPGFDLFTGTSLQSAASAGATAAVMAVLAYAQRLVQPPKF